MRHAHHREPPASPAGARPTTDPAASAVLHAFRHLFHAYHLRDFALRLWDGTEWPAETEEPSFTWVIRRRATRKRSATSTTPRAASGVSTWRARHDGRSGVPLTRADWYGAADGG